MWGSCCPHLCALFINSPQVLQHLCSQSCLLLCLVLFVLSVQTLSISSTGFPLVPFSSCQKPVVLLRDWILLLEKPVFLAGSFPCAAVSLLVMNLALWGPKLPRRCCRGWFSPINCGCSCWLGTWHIFLGMSLREDQAEQGAVQV